MTTASNAALADDLAARRRAQRRAIIANIGVVNLTVVTGGQLSSDVLQLYANQVLGLPPDRIGIALGLLVLTLPVQLLAVPLGQRWGRKRLLVTGYALTMPSVAGFLVLPAAFHASPVAGYAGLIAILLLSEITFLGSWGAAWLPWMREITPAAERGRFFARMRFAVNAFNALVLALFGALIGARVTAAGYDVLIVILLIWLVVAISQVARLPGGEPGRRSPGAPRPAGAESGPTVMARWRRLLTNRTYVNLMLVRLLIQVVTIPAYALYARNVLDVPSRVIAFQLSLRTAVGILVLLAWGRVVDRLGARLVLRIAALPLVVVIPLWFLVPPGTGGDPRTQLASLALLLVTTSLMSGFQLAHLTAVMGSVDDVTSPVGLPAYEMLQAAAGYVFVFISGLVLAATPGTQVGIGPWLYVDRFKLFMSAGVLGALLTIWVARSLPRRIAA